MTQTTRRHMIAGSSALAAGALLSSSPTWAEDRVVDTIGGKVRGSHYPGLCEFLGIPYGRAERFMAPAATEPWSGVRDATRFGIRAPQIMIPAGALPPVTAGFARFSYDPVGEDCLVLNVRTPAADNRKRPVMLWFHGGAWAVGSGQEPDYHGGNLARKNDVVVVTMNHRLNAFGYCYVGHLGDSRFAASGNAGALDMVRALEWVRDNIAQFGGVRATSPSSVSQAAAPRSAWSWPCLRPRDCSTRRSSIRIAPGRPSRPIAGRPNLART